VPESGIPIHQDAVNVIRLGFQALQQTSYRVRFDVKIILASLVTDDKCISCPYCVAPVLEHHAKSLWRLQGYQGTACVHPK
jgi:hypothetical protein